MVTIVAGLARRGERADPARIACCVGWTSIADQLRHALVPINCDKLPAVKEARWQNQATPV
jgi:hypothetical protein